MRRVGNMPAEEVFSRFLFGFILCASSFLAWGRWMAFFVGIGFLLSAVFGVCWTCILYKKFVMKD